MRTTIISAVNSFIGGITVVIIVKHSGLQGFGLQYVQSDCASCMSATKKKINKRRAHIWF